MLRVESVRFVEPHIAKIRHIRTRVFVDEQKVPENMEWDGQDVHCRQVLAYVDDDAVGTGRLDATVHIQRVAVLQDKRGCGVGKAIVEKLIAIAQEDGHAEVVLHAQCQALAFYQRLGFNAYGPVFLEAGIEHQAMRKALL